LRLGLTRLIAEAPERCRRIAARLVDHKATALASRLDELPARLYALPTAERVHQAVRELGKLVLLAQAWRADPAAPQIRRAVGAAESRAAVLQDPAARRVASQWEVAGSRVFTRRDRLISHATWLVNLGQGPAFALLQDYYPVSSGATAGTAPPGRQLAAELVYYPGGRPLRAVIASQQPMVERLPWPPPPDLVPVAESVPLARPGPDRAPGEGAPARSMPDPLAQCQAMWDAAPWELEAPLMVAGGAIAEGGPSGQLWWDGGDVALPLARPWPAALAGTPLRGFGVWDGARLDLLSAQCDFGPVWL
jgi:hypothetical protein